MTHSSRSSRFLMKSAVCALMPASDLFAARSTGSRRPATDLCASTSYSCLCEHDDASAKPPRDGLPRDMIQNLLVPPLLAFESASRTHTHTYTVEWCLSDAAAHSAVAALCGRKSTLSSTKTTPRAADRWARKPPRTRGWPGTSTRCTVLVPFGPCGTQSTGISGARRQSPPCGCRAHECGADPIAERRSACRGYASVTKRSCPWSRGWHQHMSPVLQRCRSSSGVAEAALRCQRLSSASVME